MECLKEDIPPRYHKYIPRSYSGRNSQDSECRSGISTIHLPMPTASHTSGANRFNPNQQLESTSAAEPPSYRSRSNVQVTLMLPNSYSMSRNTLIYIKMQHLSSKKLPGSFIESEQGGKSP